MNSRGFIFTLDAALSLIPVFIILATVSQMGGSQIISMQSQTLSTHYTSTDIAVMLGETGCSEQMGLLFTNYTYLLDKGETAQAALEKDNMIAYINESVVPLLPEHKGMKIEFWGIDPDDEEYLDSVFSTDNRTMTGPSSRPFENESSSEAASVILVTGYEKGLPPAGYSTKAWLEQIDIIKTASYLYWGGFVGQGTNIRKNMTIPDDIVIPDNITEISFETDTGADFNLYINGNYAGFFQEGSAGGGFLRSDKWNLSSGNFSYLINGENEIRIKSNNSGQYVGGGYFKVGYYRNMSIASVSPTVITERYYFPWISGNRINHYSSFHVPGELESMSIHLEGHFVDLGFIYTYLTIGNVTVFQATSTGHQIIDLDNAALSSMLDYNELSDITVPIRMRNGDYINYSSYIEFNYTPPVIPSIREFQVEIESDRFKQWSGDDIDSPDKEGRVFIPNNTRIVDAKATSYSSYYWTDRAYVNGNRVYWLGDYGSNYGPLGDPFNIHLPSGQFNYGEFNYVRVGTGSNPTTPRGGSPDNKIILTLAVPAQTPIIEAFEEIGEGFNISVSYDLDLDGSADGSFILPVSGGGEIKDYSALEPADKAVDNSFLRLMDSLNFVLDLNEDGYGTIANATCCYDGMEQNPIDLKLTDLKMETLDVAQVPYMWGPVRIMIKVWE